MNMMPPNGVLSVFLVSITDMQLCDAGPAIVEYILSNLEKGYRVLPSQISLKELEKSTGVRTQSIGMAFDAFIYPALLKKGVVSKKCGGKGRMVIQLHSS